VSTAFNEILPALLFTIVFEVLVAALFGFRQALWAVVAVNLVTNPVLSAFIATLYGLGLGFAENVTPGDPSYIDAAPWVWPTVGLLEAVIVVVEWRLLVWALAGKAGTSRRLLVVVIAMNVVSATIGTMALRSLFAPH
jgi:hypothetical protein